jgi:hypothetical protein
MTHLTNCRRTGAVRHWLVCAACVAVVACRPASLLRATDDRPAQARDATSPDEMRKDPRREDHPDNGLGPIGLIVLAVLISPFALILASQAHRRGFSFPVWLLAGILAVNPLFPLVLLGFLPSRTRRAQRRAAQEDLERRLAGELRNIPSSVPGPGGAKTEPPPTSPTPELPGRSVGDEETRA